MGSCLGRGCRPHQDVNAEPKGDIDRGRCLVSTLPEYGVSLVVQDLVRNVVR